MSGNIQQFLDTQRSCFASMSHVQNLAFATWCCECLFPHYVHFCEHTHPNDVNELRKAIDQLWQCVAKGSTIANSQSILDGLMRVFVGSDDDGSLERDAAVVAVDIVLTSVEAASNCTTEFAEKVAELMRHNTFAVLFEQLSAGRTAFPPGLHGQLIEAVDSSEEMQILFEKQNAVIARISSIEQFTNETIAELRRICFI